MVTEHTTDRVNATAATFGYVDRQLDAATYQIKAVDVDGRESPLGAAVIARQYQTAH
jgi:hypothetical protein